MSLQVQILAVELRQATGLPVCNTNTTVWGKLNTLETREHHFPSRSATRWLIWASCSCNSMRSRAELSLPFYHFTSPNLLNDPTSQRRKWASLRALKVLKYVGMYCHKGLRKGPVWQKYKRNIRIQKNHTHFCFLENKTHEWWTSWSWQALEQHHIQGSKDPSKVMASRKWETVDMSKHSGTWKKVQQNSKSNEWERTTHRCPCYPYTHIENRGGRVERGGRRRGGTIC